MDTNKRGHGSPYDRGGADAYYGRIPSPHFYSQGSVPTPRVEEKDMSEDEIQEYWKGYYDARNIGDRKDYGVDYEIDED